MRKARGKLSRGGEAELALLLEAERREAERVPFVDAWEFLSKAVWTRDEASGEVRRFGTDNTGYGEGRFEYLRYLTGERGKHRIRAYEKSRRMLITWWLLALYVYDVMTERNHLDAVASDKLEKSAYLLGGDRMKFIYEMIPPVSEGQLNILRSLGIDLGPFRELVWPKKPVVRFEQKHGDGWRLVSCEETASKIMAVASGETQMQQYTFSKILMDEFSRWQWGRESWRNAQPTTQGGGEIDVVATAELGSFCYDLLFDRM